MKSHFLKKAKDKVQEASGPEGYLVQAVRSLDDLDETNGLLYQRLEEWFKIHDPSFPLTGEEAAYYVAHLNDKNALLEKWPEDKLRHMAEKAETGFGASMKGTDLGAVQFLARQIDASITTRKDLEEYVRSLAQKLMPNACVLIDGLLAARLLSVIGTLNKLSLFPASTLQVLGAEKALFKHLRKGTLPPKHGLLFQSPYVNGVAFDKRGKAARALAGKLAIALKADRFTKHPIGEKLKADLEVRMAQIQALPTRNIKPIDYRDFAQKRYERREPYREHSKEGSFHGPPRGNFREGGYGSPRREGGFNRGPPRDRDFRPDRSERNQRFGSQNEGFTGPKQDRGFRPEPAVRRPSSGPKNEGFRANNPRNEFIPRERRVDDRGPRPAVFRNDFPRRETRPDVAYPSEGPRLSFKERQRRISGGPRPPDRFAAKPSFHSEAASFKGGFQGKKPWQKRRS